MYKKLSTVFYTGLCCLLIEGGSASSMNFADPCQQAQSRRVRQKFFPEEDQTLKRLVKRYGTDQWDLIAEQMPGRNARQCRERWKHYLSGELGRGDWSPEEILLLKKKYSQLGSKWTKIASFFENKTDVQVKNRIRKLQSSNDLGFSEDDLALRKRLEYEDDLRRPQVPDLFCNVLMQPGGLFFSTMPQSFGSRKQQPPSARGTVPSSQPILEPRPTLQLGGFSSRANFMQSLPRGCLHPASIRRPAFHSTSIQEQAETAQQRASLLAEPRQLGQRELVSQAVQTRAPEKREVATQSEPIMITFRGEDVDENENFRNPFGQDFNIFACNWDPSALPYPDAY